MIALARSHARRLQDRIADEMRFLKNWAEHPLRTGAVAPSGRVLSKLMVSFVEPQHGGPIVELGPGTGAMTRAMLDRGIDEHQLILIEYSADFCELLRKRFPHASVVHGDAYAMGEVLADFEHGSLASVLSSLPLFTRPVAQREKLVDDAMRLMAPGAPFIQFSYALVPPVSAVRTGCDIHRSSWVVANVPPARVWLYRRDGAAGEAPPPDPRPWYPQRVA
jgi:phosphatidylethanolamine/phosphatidyl-N-methylethanolamine N-methyltransferase